VGAIPTVPTRDTPPPPGRISESLVHRNSPVRIEHIVVRDWADRDVSADRLIVGSSIALRA